MCLIAVAIEDATLLWGREGHDSMNCCPGCLLILHVNQTCSPSLMAGLIGPVITCCCEVSSQLWYTTTSRQKTSHWLKWICSHNKLIGTRHYFPVVKRDGREVHWLTWCRKRTCFCEVCLYPCKLRLCCGLGCCLWLVKAVVQQAQNQQVNSLSCVLMYMHMSEGSGLTSNENSWLKLISGYKQYKTACFR